jgi:hypothetical protein
MRDARQIPPDEQVQAQDSLEQAMNCMSGRKRDIFRRRLAGESRAQIARNLCLSKQRISVCENQVMAAVRAAMG